MTKDQKDKLSKVGKIITTVVLIISACFLAIGIIQKVTNKNILSNKIVWVLTDSMEDTIPARSYILIKNATGSDVEVGDVITFYSSDPTLSGSLNTHRVIEINEDGEFVTKGDHSAIQDTYTVDPDNVVGIYVCNLKILTFFGRIFSTKFGLAFALILIAGAFVLINMKTLKDLGKKDHDAEIRRRIDEEVKKLEEQNKNKN